VSDDVTPLLCRLFPSFQALPPGEAPRRTEALGLFLAGAWGAGAAGLTGRGIPISEQAHGALVEVAPRVAQGRQGGVTFLSHVRRGLADDATFAQVLTGLARVYAESLKAGSPAPAAPAAAPAAPPAAPPSSGGGLDLAPEGGGSHPVSPGPAPVGAAPSWSGGLDFAPEGVSLSGERPPPPSPAPAPSGGHGLDLLPAEEEQEERVPAVPDFLLAEAPPTKEPGQGALGVSPGAEAPASNRQELEQEEGEDLETVLSQGPRDPTQKAIWSYQQTGEEGYLEEARQFLERDLQAAPHAVAAALAEAGLARVELLRGDRAKAQQHAQASLARDPSSPAAVEVLVRLDRGEAEEAGFLRAVAQLRQAVERGGFQGALPLARQLAQDYPDEPHPHLAMAFMGRAARNQEQFLRFLGEAWNRYPSQRFAHVPFGGMVDALIADALVMWAREPFKENDAERMARTVEDIDSKENLLAGALQMAVAMCRVALANSAKTKPVKRRLQFVTGCGLIGLQYFDLAPNWFSLVGTLGPTAGEVKMINAERQQAGALRRAFDRPGIKAQLKAYKCIGIQSLSEGLRRRLEAVRSDRAAKQQELFDKGGALAQAAREDTSIKTEVARAAEAESTEDPFVLLDALDDELAGVNAQRETLAAEREKPAGKAGLFGKLKAAAAGAGATAKDTALKLKQGQLVAKREAALKRLGVAVARTLSDHPWQHPVMQRTARELAVLEAFFDYYDAEETGLKRELDDLARSV
jgi:hypothetical protein